MFVVLPGAELPLLPHRADEVGITMPAGQLPPVYPGLLSPTTQHPHQPPEQPSSSKFQHRSTGGEPAASTQTTPDAAQGRFSLARGQLAEFDVTMALPRGVLVEQPVPGTALVRITGEVDHSTEAELRDAIAEGLAQQPRRLVVDLGEVVFFGSAGVAVLLHTLARAQQQRTELVLVCSSPPVRRVLELAGLLDLFTLATSVEEALSASASPE